jgi:Spc7 kinetochore protein
LNTEIAPNQSQPIKNPLSTTFMAASYQPIANNNTAEELFKQFINQDNLGGSFKPSSLGSPKNSNETNLKKADLKEFLNECGVRFLDNLTSLNRRETNSRPRDSSISAVPGRSLTVMSTSVPEGEIVEKASEILTQRILGAKDRLEKLESQFNISPPQFYSSACRNNIEQSSLRLKILKSVARLISKQEWYQWRRLTIESVANNAIEKNLASLLEIEQRLDACIGQFAASTINSDDQLEALERDLANKVNNLKERIQISTDSKEQERAQILSRGLAEATSNLRQATNNLDSLSFQESSLKLAIGQYQEDKRRKQAGIESCKKFLSETLDVNEASLQELKSQLAMQNALVHWRWITVKPDELVLEWQKTGPVRVRFEICSPGAVKAVQINSASAASRILKYSSRLILIEAGHSVSKVIILFYLLFLDCDWSNEEIGSLVPFRKGHDYCCDAVRRFSC